MGFCGIFYDHVVSRLKIFAIVMYHIHILHMKFSEGSEWELVNNSQDLLDFRPWKGDEDRVAEEDSFRTVELASIPHI